MYLYISNEFPWQDDRERSAAKYLADAEELFAIGRIRYAAVACRITIELGSIEALNAHNIWPLSPATGKRVRPSSNSFVAHALYALETAGHVTHQARSRILLAFRTGHHSSHGRGVTLAAATKAMEAARHVLAIATPKVGDVGDDSAA